jgi:poly-gamma-glutamate synthesis protein (capsule biosynthesis protein)
MLIRMRRYWHICLVLAIAAVMMLYACGYRDGGPAGTGAFVHDAGGTVAVITGDNADTAGPADIGDIAADTADTTDNVPGSAATAAGDTPGASGDPAVGVINNSADTDDNDTAVVDSAAPGNRQYTYDFTVAFAGDINLADNWDNMQYCSTTENGIYDCISPELIQMMRDADITCINNEFTFSTRGAPLKNKVYTFRAHPSNVGILKEMGVDIVSLANNHVYDYGKESLIDTMATLEQAGIEYVGAGHDLDEAMEPVYFEVQGKTVAFVAASRAEKYKMTPQATKDSPGILRCYDTALFKQVIKKARENSDYVIAYVHWGTEFTHKLEDVQLSTGKEYLDAGADIVIGAHPHRLQGIEFYKGKPIIYSLGNFWFNDETVDTVLLKIRFFGNDTEEYLELKVVPAIQADLRTTIVTDDAERERIFSLLERISVNAEISGKGIITERAAE